MPHQVSSPARSVRSRRRRLLLTAVVAASCLAMGTMGSGVAVSAPSAVRSGPDTAEGDGALRARLSQLSRTRVAAAAPGVIVRVDDGRGRPVEIVEQAPWAARGHRLDAGDEFRMGSNTKTMMATLVLQLAAEGRLTLDDPVQRWLPGRVPDGGAITLRMLLNHTSGLFNYTEDPSFSFDEDPAALQQWLDVGRWRPYAPGELVGLAAQHPPYFAPGQGWHYSNTNYVVIGMLIERLTGRGWADEVQRRIIRPLGLTGTSMPLNSPFVPGPHAHGYYKLASGPADVTLLDPSMAGASGAGISTTTDLARFVSALLGGRLLAPAQLAEMKRTTPQSGPAEYGLGLQRTSTACGEYWGHSGGIPGYTTLMYGASDGRRQFTASVNPYDLSDLPAANATVEALVATGLCDTHPATPPTPPTATGTLAATGVVR
ncbi:serine hydrolase domain-containing protein [Kitasatospora sp. NPDC058263]